VRQGINQFEPAPGGDPNPKQARLLAGAKIKIDTIVAGVP
jgi:hypothetical protein